MKLTLSKWNLGCCNLTLRECEDETHTLEMGLGMLQPYFEGV
jgi:hypothetical protein